MKSTAKDESSGAVEIVDLRRFLQATRDSGYRNFQSSIAELVDNSLQAEATQIDISIYKPGTSTSDAHVAIMDNGSGMSRDVLSLALQFGGSSRFNDREGLGRFGMGLPNSSLSQARRVDVYSWQNRRTIWHTYLDLDELVDAETLTVPTPVRAKLPEPYTSRSSSGTLVVWRKLDRLRGGAWSLLEKRLAKYLGQKFRHFLWAGRNLTCNGNAVAPFDPLFLSSETRSPFRSAPFGDVLKYPFRLGEAQAPATVEVQFSELPVTELAHLSNSDKRSLGIVNGAGVSIVRAGREIDYGWFFFDKRRENYDDWWRCEISFPPDLDEMFGVTHTKQGIRPSDELREILTRELSLVARTLNRSVQKAHMIVAQERISHAAAEQESARDVLLRPIVRPQEAERLEAWEPEDDEPPLVVEGNRRYRLEMGEVADGTFYRVEVRANEIVVVLNTLHEFYQCFEREFGRAQAGGVAGLRKTLELVLLALGRSHFVVLQDDEDEVIERFVAEWSRAVAVFCGASPKER